MGLDTPNAGHEPHGDDAAIEAKDHEKSALSPHSSANSYEEQESLSESTTNDEDVDRTTGDNAGLSRTTSSLCQAPSKTVLSFEPGDPENPYNWSYTRRAIIVLIGVITVLNSTLGSSLPSGDADQLSAHFGITNEEQLVLPISMFLVGYVLGPLLFGPLSESHGRQVVMMGTFALYTVFSIAIPFSPNYAAFVIFRLLCGTFASSPISVIGGLYADLYDNATHRGRAMAMFMVATSWGPLSGPIVSGYLAVYSWRWPYWFGLIFAGVSWIPLLFLPETFGPIILKRRAKKIRKTTGGTAVYAPIELEQTNFQEIVVKVLTRPFRMFFTEAIVLFSCLFLCLIYGIYYMFFQVFPLIYPPIYGFSYGELGLAFISIGIGAIVACVIYLWWDHYLFKAKERNESWAHSEEYRRLPLGCIGGPFFCIGIFWIGWAARASVHWIVPILGGIPVGLGFLLLFMSLINYIVDAYDIYAASAMAAASCSRSLFGAVLPFAGKPMFVALGIAWASSLLGFISLAMCVIPFVFLRFGDKIRARSKFCQQLEQEKKDKQEEADRRRRRQERWERKQSETAQKDPIDQV